MDIQERIDKYLTETKINKQDAHIMANNYTKFVGIDEPIDKAVKAIVKQSKLKLSNPEKALIKQALKEIRDDFI